MWGHPHCNISIYTETSGLISVMWIRIRVQRYKIKGKLEFNQKNFVFFGRKLYFFKSASKKVAYLNGLGRDLKIYFFLDF